MRGIGSFTLFDDFGHILVDDALGECRLRHSVDLNPEPEFSIGIVSRHSSTPSAEYYFSQVLRYKPDHFAAISQLNKCKVLESKLRK
jgi:hypothetical protein